MPTAELLDLARDRRPAMTDDCANFVRGYLMTYHVGRRNAIDRLKLLRVVRAAGYPDMTDRGLRLIYADELLLPTCARGVYWPQSWGEIEDAMSFWRQKIVGLQDRITKTEKVWLFLRPIEQMALFAEGPK